MRRNAKIGTDWTLLALVVLAVLFAIAAALSFYYYASSQAFNKHQSSLKSQSLDQQINNDNAASDHQLNTFGSDYDTLNQILQDQPGDLSTPK